MVDDVGEEEIEGGERRTSTGEECTAIGVELPETLKVHKKEI